MQIRVTQRNGSEHAVEASAGLSLMEAIRDSTGGDLLALCGGSCSCATCHVVVAPEWIAAVGAPGEDESDLLDGSPHRTPQSRLSCQVRLVPALDGLRVTIAAED